MGTTSEGRMLVRCDGRRETPRFHLWHCRDGYRDDARSWSVLVSSVTPWKHSYALTAYAHTATPPVIPRP